MSENNDRMDHTPTPATIAAMQEARSGGLKPFDSIEALLADLNADDAEERR